MSHGDFTPFFAPFIPEGKAQKDAVIRVKCGTLCSSNTYQQGSPRASEYQEAI